MKPLKLKILALLILPALLCACPKEKARKGTEDGKEQVEAAEVRTPFKTIEADGAGFSISVPKDWNVQKGGGNPVVFASAPGSDKNGPSTNVVVEELSQRMAPYDYLEANLVTMQISLPNLEVLQQGTGLHSGIQMAWILYTYPRDEVKVVALTYCQTRNYTAYVVTSMCPADRFDQYKSVFVKIGQSLRVK
ncbi:MAG: hypothetical protein R6V10_06585 [bacterium]